jgi:hypothetical protein
MSSADLCADQAAIIDQSAVKIRLNIAACGVSLERARANEQLGLISIALSLLTFTLRLNG